METVLKFRKRKKSVNATASAVSANKFTKKRDARTKLLFCQSKPIAFLTFSLLPPSSLLRLPKNVREKTLKKLFGDSESLGYFFNHWLANQGLNRKGYFLPLSVKLVYRRFRRSDLGEEPVCKKRC